MQIIDAWMLIKASAILAAVQIFTLDELLNNSNQNSFNLEEVEEGLNKIDSFFYLQKTL